jgi:hypothetical protein
MTKTHRQARAHRLPKPDLPPAGSSWLTPLHDALAVVDEHARRIDAQNAATRRWQRNGGWLIERSGRS